MVSEEVVAAETSVLLPAQRNEIDLLASEVLGIAAIRVEQRTLAAFGKIEATPLKFESCQSLPYGGVLLLLPFLIENGLMSYRDHYRELDRGYYYIEVIILLLAFMYLCRIKSVEQLKQVSPGDFGKLLGLDRIPEVKCMRNKVRQIANQEKAGGWMMDLGKNWAIQEENEFYYIDGHVQIYYGHKAKLGKKYISRQKLCLPGMQEFWVNNQDGAPYFFVTGRVNEKLQEAITGQIIPKLLTEIPCKYSEQELASDPELPRFTIVFDREAYSPVFFHKLWQDNRVAVLTYRKNVKDTWDTKDFTTQELSIGGVETQMDLSEKQITLDKVPMREIRKLNKNGHQTSILTTNRKITTQSVAVHMFSRWTQENFFRYMRQDYRLDSIVQNTIDQIDKILEVVNPEYNNLTYRIKKIREKITRRKAHLYTIQEQLNEHDIDHLAQKLAKQSQIQEELNNLENHESQAVNQRKALRYKIEIKDMPDAMRYNSLNMESKRFQNVIKMICYRAESAMASLLAPHYKRSKHEKRSLIKSLIQSPIDLICNDKTKQLTVSIYSQSNPRMNKAIEKLCLILNETESLYPGTDLKLYYQIATSQTTPSQEF